MNKYLHLKIPASTANLGVGFDSIGMAIDKYLNLYIHRIEGDEWEFDYLSPELNSLPNNKDNYIYQVAQQVAAKYNIALPALKIEMRSDIPLARGLGSSASALVGALYIANYFGNIQLSKYELLQLATEIEGHPDNVAPTIYGGLLAGYYNPETKETNVAHIEVPDVDIILTIPPYELKTEDSRNVLPDNFSHKKAIQNSAISNTMICALIQHNYELAGKMMGQDGFHEPFRQHLIPEFEQVKALANKYDAYATVISGAGPTILTFSRKEKSGELVRTLKHQITNCHSELATINQVGVVEQIVYPS
ncbi:homoserine kinase [Staphylococcus sp. NRL 16/872]|uniref:homoserine kinase n=1 Tax=Staphylococcus sp. NRL 16/872 TaxID=2930131 RepID=UPI001FB3EF1D|nr:MULTISPECIES: homoserine kinase [unclassified Staphylococcus]MCJ1656440.1 homoserine kinase [Staphylococcus sp. NRL 21/187]MCJ1662206.1 homoserine kinase [Staphylococcus sp. NRL 18/288]MCJ1668278.1 homoserine kinase [Staphylococcus sp. NRL 19/737]WEN68477.1 homoserine kinase [Staphylococcus sp. NRL 16/872]